MWDISLVKTVVSVAIVMGVCYTVWRQYQQSSHTERVVAKNDIRKAVPTAALLREVQNSPMAKIAYLFNRAPNTAHKAD